LKIDIRRNKILDILRKEGKVYVSQLSKILDTSPVTIRNDLASLESDGHLVRMSGGAVPTNNNTANLNCSNKGIQNLEEKQAIAHAVSELIKDGDTLFINSGTTTQIIAHNLKNKKNLNIVTNSIKVATELGSVPSFKVIILGGEINSQYGFTYGGDAQEHLNHFAADWAILSVDSISIDGVITTYHAEEAIIDRLMITRAKQVIIPADHSKIGRIGFTFVSGCSNNIRIITNDSSDTLAEMNKKGILINSI